MHLLGYAGLGSSGRHREVEVRAGIRGVLTTKGLCANVAVKSTKCSLAAILTYALTGMSTR